MQLYDTYSGCELELRCEILTNLYSVVSYEKELGHMVLGFNDIG